jgi:hypothetical protein
LVEGNSDPGPAHAQHQGQEVVGQSQAISRRNGRGPSATSAPVFGRSAPPRWPMRNRSAVAKLLWPPCHGPLGWQPPVRPANP